MFIDGLKNELNTETKLTENEAIGFSTSGKNLVDMNFRVSSYRNMSDTEIFNDFIAAYNEDPILAMRWVFFARDPRGGLGERRLFRVILSGLLTYEGANAVEKIMHLIPMFGRWDDLFIFLGTSVEKQVFSIIFTQLCSDVKNAQNGEPISLLGKWMPSINCSNKERRKMAEKFARKYDLSFSEYRKMLSKLRGHLNVVERKMSAGEWDAVDYSAVPSRANLIYNSTFLKRDELRRREFLDLVEAGKAKINSGVNFPHDIVSKYNGHSSTDSGLEELWKALPNYGGLKNTLVVADGSGSMLSTIGKTKISALDVANSLAIYFAERCEGRFKNHYITFSQKPQLVYLGDLSLYSRIQIAKYHNEVANTNIQAVFELILKTAIDNKLRQEEIPDNILIISDMEFDRAAVSPFYMAPNKALFTALSERFEEHGYKMPKLSFWNTMSRTMTIPFQDNDAGVTLISGFSPSAIKIALNSETDPGKALLEVLMDPKYDVVEQSLKE